MAFKYKLKEAPDYNLAKQTGAKIGDVSYSKDGKTKFVVNSIDPETGQIGWKVINLPAFEKLNDDIDALVATAKGVYTKTKDDEKFREFYEESRLLRNKIRKHLRNEYPEEYKRMTMEGEVDEISTSGAAGAYNTKYAFKLPKKQKKLEEGAEALKVGDKLTLDGKEGKIIKVMDDMVNVDFGNGSIYGITLSRIKGFEIFKENQNPGATLGPGPKSSEEGVKDNYYVKKFKYQLVPKDKNGNYVQKGSGLEVKNF